MRRRAKKPLISNEIPVVTEATAKRQVIFGTVGFVLSLGCVLAFRPGSGEMIELVALIGIVSSATVGAMKLATLIKDSEQSENE